MLLSVVDKEILVLLSSLSCVDIQLNSHWCYFVFTLNNWKKTWWKLNRKRLLYMRIQKTTRAHYLMLSKSPVGDDGVLMNNCIILNRIVALKIHCLWPTTSTPTIRFLLCTAYISQSHMLKISYKKEATSLSLPNDAPCQIIASFHIHIEGGIQSSSWNKPHAVCVPFLAQATQSKW